MTIGIHCIFIFAQFDKTLTTPMDWAKDIDKLPDTFESTPDQMLDKECNSFQCGCCCSDVLIKDMVQCADGHLFCFMCLRRRVEESTFGGLSAYGPLGCMDMNGCDKSIPWSEIARGIQGDLIIKFEQRQANESLARANLQGLIHCPACNFACVVDPDVKVFNCPNKQCRKATCMKCKQPSHEPLRCEDLEKPPDTRARNEVEEVMSKTIIRVCVACEARLVKDDGCNKITCKCGQRMCYICRQPINDYKHFCEHFRNSDHRCKECDKCNLWQQEDRNTMVQNAMHAAIESKARENPSILIQQIGPQISPTGSIWKNNKRRYKASRMRRVKGRTFGHSKAPTPPYGVQFTF